MNTIGIVERACQIAREGKSGTALRKQLSIEGYSSGEIGAHLRGASIRATLKELAAGAVREQGQPLPAHCP